MTEPYQGLVAVNGTPVFIFSKLQKEAKTITSNVYYTPLKTQEDCLIVSRLAR